MLMFDSNASGVKSQTEPTSDKADGQHWKTVQELWMRNDKERCEAWKDEVQNVLIFSGLFSAIVTAFLVLSLTDLRPDTGQESVQLLRQIAAQSAGQNWTAEFVQQGIDRVSISVNIFWFLSLVFSLTTALMGIVSLQWIRSHMRNLGDGPDALGLSYMHSRGLHQSYIPGVFASLPIILIFGLTFFLIGLVIFLFKLSWQVAIPVSIAIACTFTFLLVTTFIPALQSCPPQLQNDDKSPAGPLTEEPKCFPSPYRSPQSSLFIPWRDWGTRSKIWLQYRRKHLIDGKKPLGHLKPSHTEDAKRNTFAYDTIKALLSVQKSRTAESEKEKKALAKCLAEVLPSHLDVFPTGDLADLIPFLPPSEYVPASVFLRDSATREDLSAVALLQIATCKGRPFRSPRLVGACLRATRWLFEQPHALNPVPEKHPLHLISQYGTSHLVSEHSGRLFAPDESSDPNKLSLDALEALVDTLSRFFNFAANYQPNDQIIGQTTYTSPYTYWFLVSSAEIISASNQPLSDELLARHSYILNIIAVRLGKKVEGDYLFYTAWIYASRISTSQILCSSLFCGDFLHAVKGYHDNFLNNVTDYSQLPLCKALKVDEVGWVDICQALKGLQSLDTSGIPDPHEANNMNWTERPGDAVVDMDTAGENTTPEDPA